MVHKRKIPSTKGNLAAVIHHPAKATERLAILCTGYLDTKDYQHLIDLAERLAKDGYTVVRFDPTGTWESEGGIADYTTTQYLNDKKNILQHMLKKNAYSHVLLGGHSRGGMVSILYAARDPRISIVLGIMPSSGRSMTKKRREEWQKTGMSVSQRDLPFNKDQVKEFQVPYSHVDDRDLYDVIKDVEKIHVPIILVAGELDDLVLPKDVQEIYDHANEPKRFVTIANVGHDYRHSDTEVAVVHSGIVELLNEFV